MKSIYVKGNVLTDRSTIYILTYKSALYFQGKNLTKLETLV